MKKMLVILMMMVCTMSAMAYTQNALDSIRIMEKMVLKQSDIDLENVYFSKIYELNTGEYISFLNPKFKKDTGSVLMTFDRNGMMENSEYLKGITEKDMLQLFKTQGFTIKNSFKNNITR